MPSRIQGLRLLLVEDEFVLALGLTDTLGDLGAEVLGPVATVGDAMALIESMPEIDAAILDVNLGTEVVYPVADALIARSVPFFFSTANAHVVLPPRFAHIGVCRKPFAAAEFRAALDGLDADGMRRAG
ncbi:MAG: response regulator [Lysobacter sp.]|nr:MAG: response regulator [Lysobacter sp.]